MSSKPRSERIGTVVVVSLLAVCLLATVSMGTVGALTTAGTTDGTGSLTPAVSGTGSDTVDASAFAPSDGTSTPAAIGQPPAQTEGRNRIVFDHTEGARATYEVTVSGSIEAGPEADLTDAESVDTITGNTATGSVAEGGDDDYFFTGEITSLDVDGPLTVYVNGERINPDDFDGATTTTATPSPFTSTTTTATPTPTETETDTETATEPSTTTETEPSTTTETPTETTAPTTETATGTTTSSPTATPNASRATTGAPGGESQGFTDQERGLFLTIGGVLLLGILAIGAFVWFARQE